MIAVYAVKLNLDSEDPQEVATFDESKAEALRVVFLDMHELSLMFGFFLFYRDIINNIKAGKENEIQRMVKRLVRVYEKESVKPRTSYGFVQTEHTPRKRMEMEGVC